MKVRVLVVAVATALMVSACGGDGGESGGGDGAEPTSEDLTSMLLTLDDMPSGWSTYTDDMGSDDAEETTDDDTFCPEAESVVEDDSDDEVEAMFSQGELGPFVFQGISPSTKEEYERVVDALDSCIGEEWTTTDEDGVESKYAMEELSAPDLGEDSRSYRMTATFDGGLLTADLVTGHSEGAAVLLMGTSMTTFLGSSELSAEDFDEIVNVANDKLG